VARGEAAPLAETRKLDETRPTAMPPTVAIKQQKRRNVAIEALVIGAFLAVAAVVLVIALTAGSSDPNRPLTDSDVEAAASAFARAYTHEDTRAMARLLSPDVERVSASDVQHGRSSVIAAYRAQFRSQVTRAYKLDGLQIKSGPVGRAQANFRVERAGRPAITGNVVLGVERRNGRPRIRLIATESRT
jgi:ketosteroid isomerase-like protein